VNARSADGRTPLAIAAGVAGNARIVKLLLDRGADASPKEPGTTEPLLMAAYAGDPATIRLLQNAGAALKGGGAFALELALQAECAACVDLLLPGMDAAAVARAAKGIAPPDFDARSLRLLLARQTAVSFKGTDILARAAATDMVPADLIKMLIDRGADLTATLPDGQNAVSAARRRGATRPWSTCSRKPASPTRPRPRRRSRNPRPRRLRARRSSAACRSCNGTTSRFSRKPAACRATTTT
jgi:ankyrin repeat protein